MTISSRSDEQAQDEQTQLGSSEAFEVALTGIYADHGRPDIAEPRSGLRGRGSECRALDRLVADARAGRSAVLVLRGEAGAGKSALLEFVVTRAPDCRIARAAGVESEMELAFAGLHQLCGPMLDHLDHLPGPQRDALSTAFGLSADGAPDRFLVGLAVLSLLADVAEDQPLVCVVDDAQWLDQASAQALAFVARRLLAEPVALVFAARSGGPKQGLEGLPELPVRGLSAVDARGLLAAALRGPLDEAVRDRIVAESRGNPLALLELPRGLTPAELAGGFGLPGVTPLASLIEQGFVRRLEPLAAQTRQLLLTAAAEGAGDVTLLWRAAGRLGIGPDAAAPAQTAGLIEAGPRVRFRHPLVRSAAYRSASVRDRRDVHAALAEVTDPVLDPDRRAWHLAHAAAGRDEAVAAELERSASRAQARGGLAAAAAFLDRAAALTPERPRRSARALAAAQAKHQAGAADAALGLLAMAEAGPLDELQRARADLLRGQIAFTSGRGGAAPALLLAAARRLEPLDAALARDTYLEAFSATMFAGQLAGDIGVREVARAARGAPPSCQPRNGDRLLDGRAVLFTDGYPAAVPISRRALQAFCREDVLATDGLRWLWLATLTAADLWDDESWHVLSTRHVQIARQAGALSDLPLALASRVFVHLFAGELAAAASLVEEMKSVREATGSNFAPYGALALAALSGRGDEVDELIGARMSEVVRRGDGLWVTVSRWASAVLGNGLGRYEQALAAARQVCEDPPQQFAFWVWSLAELVEAAVRCGQAGRACSALQQLAETAHASGTDWALGMEVRARAQLSEGNAAENLYAEAIERLGRTRARLDFARARLLYGEWLRRAGRRVDAREQLRAAHQMLTAMGVEGFAERARRELAATGEAVPKQQDAGPREELTAQETQIARLAGDGRTNPEIGAELFISPRTVEWHLHKVYPKLGISSRRQLHEALTST
jgi:DNA-binding CsgD family transcriptional regulator/tetratricopeptide (TPR) repeat protein